MKNNSLKIHSILSLITQNKKKVQNSKALMMKQCQLMALISQTNSGFIQPCLHAPKVPTFNSKAVLSPCASPLQRKSLIIPVIHTCNCTVIHGTVKISPTSLYFPHSFTLTGSSVRCSSILPPCTFSSKEKKSSSSIGPGALLLCSSSLP